MAAPKRTLRRRADVAQPAQEHCAETRKQRCQSLPRNLCPVRHGQGRPRRIAPVTPTTQRQTWSQNPREGLSAWLEVYRIGAVSRRSSSASVRARSGRCRALALTHDPHSQSSRSRHHSQRRTPWHGHSGPGPWPNGPRWPPITPPVPAQSTQGRTRPPASPRWMRSHVGSPVRPRRSRCIPHRASP